MFSLLTLNVKGLISHQKQLCLHELTKNTKSSILCLQETNLQEDSSFIHSNNFHFYINPPVQPQSGVAIALSNDIYHEVEILSHQDLFSGYVQALNFKVKEKEYCILNVYMPQALPNALKVIEQLNSYLNKLKEETTIIVAGDWNATLEEKDRLNCVEIRTQLVNELKILLTQHNLEDVWRNFNPEKSQFTFRGLHQNHPMSRLDRIYMKKTDLHLVHDTKIIPSFSDHSAVSLLLHSPTTKYRPPYWKFDNSLLNSKEFQQIVKNILLHFQEQSKQAGSDINIIWDKLKEELKFASQRYAKKSREEEKQQLAILLSHFSYLESKELSPEDTKILLSIEHEIANLYKNKAAENLKIIEAQTVKEANTSSKFFLRLAKLAKPSSVINQLEVNGEVTNERPKIFKAVYEEYKENFSNAKCNEINPSSPLYKDLPKISHEEREFCEEPITKEEILHSIQKAQLNRAPGFDGITIEFYKFFWKEIQDLIEMLFKNFQTTGQLSNSMKKVIITPVPKKGNRNKINNWRPIALLNCDYKILSRIISKRISSVVSVLLTSDQSYCVPGRTIYNNLHLLRNIIRDSNKRNTPLAILSLDQIGAFNNVSHDYIQHLLHLHGFGPKLCSAVTSLLKTTQGHVKMGPSLLPPFPFKTGIRQGDPIAGPLYIISVEPFLRSIMKTNLLAGYSLPGTQLQIFNTAFADDIQVFITKEEDFKNTQNAFKEYSHQSSALLNEEKSSCLFTGQWKHRTDTPISCHCSSEGMKFLGVHLGNTEKYEDQNWLSLTSKIQATLNNWTRYVKLTSYHGRKIICNQLIGSQLVHVLTILQPPPEFFTTIHKHLINFIWQGKHWLHPNLLFAPLDKGGIGLNNLEAKTNTLRLSLISKLQENYSSTEPSIVFHFYQMANYNNSKPSHIFCQDKQEIEMTNLDSFYHSLMSTWYSIHPKLVTEKFTPEFIKKTPLFGTQIVKKEDLTIIEEWKQLSFKTIGDLMKPDGEWKIIKFPNHNPCAQRRLTFNYNRIKLYFNKKMKPQYHHPTEDILTFSFQDHENKQKIFPPPKKLMYQASLQNLLQKPPVSGCAKITQKKVTWTSLYHHPIEKKDSDVAWRLLHNALVTPKKLFQWKVIQSPLCPWCKEEGNIVHMIFECTQTKNLWKFVSHKIQIINKCPPLTLDQAILGFSFSTNQGRLTNFLLTLAKSTVYRTYMNLIKKEIPVTPHYLLIYKKRLQYRLNIESHHAKVRKDFTTLQSLFLINDALSCEL